LKSAEFRSVYDGCLSIIGGTGALGRSLALRALRHGIPVCIGSRNIERARTVCDELRADIPEAVVIAASNLVAAQRGAIVVVTVPFAHQIASLQEIKPGVSGKIVIDTTVPLMPPKVARVQLPTDHSAAVQAQRILGESARVVSALHNTSALLLGSASGARELGDVLVFGDDKASRATVIELLQAIGLRALHAGPLANSTSAEAMTSVLIFMNKAYGTEHAGLRITSLPEPA
jgi:NADPH-dependent F420 reductase